MHDETAAEAIIREERRIKRARYLARQIEIAHRIVEKVHEECSAYFDQHGQTMLGTAVASDVGRADRALRRAAAETVGYREYPTLVGKE